MKSTSHEHLLMVGFAVAVLCIGATVTAQDVAEGRISMITGSGEADVYRIPTDDVEVRLRAKSFRSDVLNGQNVFLRGDSLETRGTESTATVWFEGTGGLLHLAEQSGVTLDGHLHLEHHLLLTGGTVVLSVSDPSGSGKWSAVSVSLNRTDYALVRGGSLRVTITDGVPGFELLSGEGWMYEGKRIDPRTPIVDADGALSDTGTAMPASHDGLVEQFARRTEEISRFGRGAAGVWISDAEQGDLTPQRGQEGSAMPPFSEENVQRLTFDQTTTASFAFQSTGVIDRRVTTGLISVSQSLFQTDSAANFAIAARIQNTRIIGPGFSGPLSTASLLTGNREFLPIRIRK